MAKIVDLKNVSTASLGKRKANLVSTLQVPANILRASFVKQYFTCGKKNCRCRRGRKHGPFYYVVQSLQAGRVRKFLLKTEDSKKQAVSSIAAYADLQSRIEELSQINTELLQRGEVLART